MIAGTLGISRSAATASRRMAIAQSTVVRSLKTSAALAQKKQGADRTQSTAFIKKEGGSNSKKLRSGTATAVNTVGANPEYYVSNVQTNLRTLDESTANDAHINKFMEIDGAFLDGIGKGHLPGVLEADFKLFGRPALLYRKLTQQLVDQLAKHAGAEATAAAAAVPKRASVIDGKNGAGKSAELMKLASVAAASGHIVIYASSTVSWVNSSRPYAPANDSDLFVQHEVTMDLLRSVASLSKEALGKVPLGKSVVVGKKTLAADKTLADLVEFGIHTPSLAHDVLENLLAIASAQKQVPVLIALDSVNTLWCATSYTDQQDVVLPASRLRLVNAFLPFFEGKAAVASGWVVGATSYVEPRFMPKDLRLKLNPPPMVPLANADVASDPSIARPASEVPFEVIKVDRLSADEAQALMLFYHKTSVISTPVTNALVAKKWVFADGNPREIFKSVTTYF
ncbi:hypothetical protein H4R99_001309 [Coemansia sp. RSA 1722]|nr:hypothetical protein GGF39_001688 [Coemansia sp. RSA 1721]KAJ2605199.1 hypothetical protein H4R99_001309 [Coemansia sp. RSA 1722]KAJ2640333.1 hypothetical protein GGF40_000232 [Coemansia sp. RSA 1286]